MSLARTERTCLSTIPDRLAIRAAPEISHPMWVRRGRPRCHRRRDGTLLGGRSALHPEGVGLLEPSCHSRAVGGLLQQGFRVPFASWNGEEITPVDVEGAGQAGDGVGHRMNDV